MASRYTETKPLDYCLHPVRLTVDQEVFYVPCGKCDGCLLHNANEWSMRLGCEIEDNHLAIFFTLTYSNKYLPTFVYSGMNPDGKLPSKVFTCLHDKNIRFDGVKDVPRHEKFILFDTPVDFTGVPATNYVCDREYFPYSSKRDFQLYLKLLRKDVYNKNQEGFFGETIPEEETRFRYFAISEYGETLLRPHIHAVVLPQNPLVADYLCYSGLFANWQMCRQDKFQQYCHFADSGCRGYITQYLTCTSNLPQVYQDSRIKPWRLSSKAKAIGYNGYDQEKVFEDFSIGVDEYSKTISRLDERYILRYPKDFGNTLFPKCYEYRKKDFLGLYRIYSVLWLLRREESDYSAYFINRLSEVFNPADIQAAKACLKACDMMHWHPFTYVYTLDMFWYKQGMAALRHWYQFQEREQDPWKILLSYTNLVEFVHKCKYDILSSSELQAFYLLLQSFGYSILDILNLDESELSPVVDDDYVLELSDILNDMVKMPKFNEKYGLSPNSNF